MRGSMGRVDTAGFMLEFKPGRRYGGKFVHMSVIRGSGDLMC